MGFTIKIDDKLKIIRYRHKGIVNKKEIGKAWQQLILIKEFTEQNYHLLSDYRNSIFKFNIDMAEALSEQRNKQNI